MFELMNLQETNPLSIVVLLAGMALIPFLVLGMTSFLKLTVVFSILRNALGAGQVPSATISTLLALVLSGFIMAPTALEIAENFQRESEQGFPISDSKAKNTRVKDALQSVSVVVAPLRTFLKVHSGTREAIFFRDLYAARLGKNDGGDSFAWLIPAFVLTELREAFVIGLTIYVPFLAVDLIVANILVGLGMVMVSPSTISLPLKILLFVSTDAWLLLVESLIAGYSVSVG